MSASDVTLTRTSRFTERELVVGIAPMSVGRSRHARFRLRRAALVAPVGVLGVESRERRIVHSLPGSRLDEYRGYGKAPGR
jgi:hypothetical protein